MPNLNTHSHWRDSARPVKFFFWDAKAVFPMLFFLLYISWWTFFLALGAVIFFSILNRYGFSIEVFGRWLRSTLAGKHKPANPWWMQ